MPKSSGPISQSADTSDALWDKIRARQPGFREAIAMDARVLAGTRGERAEFKGSLDTLLQVLRLAFVTDAFLAQIAYRLKASLQAKDIPLLPAIANRVAMMAGGINISDAAVLEPGVLIPHGQIFIQGATQVRALVQLMPWTTLGLIGTDVVGPSIGPGARINTGAKVLGGVTVGANARVGANAVVLSDVEAGTTVVGMPAKAISD